jgi:two-component system, chemotaxis family, CheB/CheR fusion protein
MNKSTTTRKRKTASPTAPGPAAVAQPLAGTGDGQAGEQADSRFPVVGVGASAGGLDALKRLLMALPARCGVAFVLVPHLDPGHQSLMPELLARHCKLPVSEASDGGLLHSDHVYVLPPDRVISVLDGRLLLETREGAEGGYGATIDGFLSSLARERGRQSIAIILSGTGGHGAAGIKEIKLAGGMVMAQEPASAEFPQMPASAIATGVVDHVLRPEQMARALLAYVRHPYVSSPEPDAATDAEGGPALNAILTLLRNAVQCDFRLYRRKMLLRRVQRRMSLLEVISLREYLDLLQQQPAELHALFKELLISVTDFFRDPEAWEELAQRVLPQLVAQAADGQPVRVWVPGCATGEEAYSLAILLVEQFVAAAKPANIQIFATDIDSDALEIARQGIYPLAVLSQLSRERLKRHFVQIDEHRVQVSKQLREYVVFAQQNLISDAPFSRIDLVSCRNLLIYLEFPVQQKIISMFHFALKDNGCLLLGPAESIGRQGGLFDPVSKKWRLFRRVGSRRQEALDVSLLNAGERPLRLARADAQRHGQGGYAELTARALLEAYAPATVLINRHFDVLYFHGATGGYLEYPTGEPSRNLMTIARQGLRSKIRAAVERAMASGEPVVEPTARVRRDGEYARCQLTVNPIRDPGDAGLMLVTFTDIGPEPERGAATGNDGSLVGRMEDELKVTRDDLRATIEELAGSNAELRASNEEVMSMNEELQCANEELETSKEELQSLNEELGTVNNQLIDKVDELESVNNDIVNLLHSSEIATVFLGADMILRRFTPASKHLFNFIASDEGRPISDISRNFSDPALLEDALAVMGTLSPLQAEVQGSDGRVHLRRILPYRTADNHIDGVVITFVDISERKDHEEQIRRMNVALEQQIRERTAELENSEALARAMLQSAPDAIISVDRTGAIERFNPAAERIFGYTAAQAIGKNAAMLTIDAHADVLAVDVRRYLVDRRAGMIDKTYALEGLRADGSCFPIEATVNEIDRQGCFVCVVRDVSSRRLLQRAVANISDEEQRRLGQDLHDGAQQELVGLGLLAAALARSLEAAGRAEAATARRLSEGLTHAVEFVRSSARELIAAEVQSLGLSVAIKTMVERLQEQVEARCRFSCKGKVAGLDSQKLAQVYRIAQEAINNAVKHSGARNIDVMLTCRSGQLTLVIRDDGCGFDIDGESSTGMGLGIMRYRAEIIGGRLRIDHADGGGTVVVLECPLTD